jgi:hypothetical protein
MAKPAPAFVIHLMIVTYGLTAKTLRDDIGSGRLRRIPPGCPLRVKSGKAHDEHNTSAIPSRADIERRLLDVRFGPKPEV